MEARSSIRVQLGARSPALLCGRPIESCGQGRRPVQRALLCTPHPSLRPGPTPWLCQAGGWHPPACGARSSLLSAHQEGLGAGAHSTRGALLRVAIPIVGASQQRITRRMEAAFLQDGTRPCCQHLARRERGTHTPPTTGRSRFSEYWQWGLQIQERELRACSKAHTKGAFPSRRTAPLVQHGG